MKRYKLKKNSRPKALFGEAAVAAATIAGATMQAAAAEKAAREQAKAIEQSAATQAQSIKDQTANNNALQKESIDFTRQQNRENQQLQKDINMTLQRLAGQQNLNDIMESNKASLKYGGKKQLGSGNVFYGGARKPFKVIDGGGAVPLAIDSNGYGIYELYGNDHEHYHKAPGGKNKTGVGIKFNDGTVVEGEGNQNGNKGELLYITPNDALFLSKHSIDGFNPADAVKNGVHPAQAFAIQESLKNKKGIESDGSKTSIRAKAKDGTSKPKEPNFWRDNTGGIINAGGNIIGGVTAGLGSYFAGKSLSKAYSKAGDIIADAYGQMKGIDMSLIDKADYTAPKSLAVVRGANTNINPQLERIRRNAEAETREINRNTASSAARQQRLAATNDRMAQRLSEQYTYKDNTDEQIKQGNAERITAVAQANADREAQSSKDYTAARLSLAQYNNSVENNAIAGAAQARADALSQSSVAANQGLQSLTGNIGNAIIAGGSAIQSSIDANRKYNKDLMAAYAGLGDAQQITYALSTGDVNLIRAIYAKHKGIESKESKEHVASIEAWAANNNVKL